MEQMAGQIMTKKLVTVRYDDSVRTAYQVMRERKIRHLPVSDALGEVIGILSDRDLQRAMTPKAEFSPGAWEEPEFDESFRVKDFMTWPVRSVSRDVTIEEVAKRMLNEKVSAFLVRDHERTASGILTTDDLLKVLIRLLQKEPGRLQMSLETVMEEFRFPSGNWV